MESLREILKRGMLKNISADATDTSSNTEAATGLGFEQQSPLPEELAYQCQFCKDAGYVVLDVPYGHPDFGRVVPCDCSRRALETERLEFLLQRSNLGPLRRLTFENLAREGRSGDPDTQRRFRHAYNLAYEFAERPEGWLVLGGVSGCGKTHMAAALANHCLDRGLPVLFIVVPDLLDHLRSTFTPGSEVTYDALFEEVRNVPLLVLDDLGTHSATPWAQEKLYQIINHRYNTQLPTVFTTNVPLGELEERLRTRLTDPTLCKVCIIEERGKLIPPLESLGQPTLDRMTFENFDRRRLNLSVEQLQSLEGAYRAAHNFALNPEGWLILLGSYGCGKTHLAAAIANYRLKQDQPTLFVVVPDLLDHLRSTFSPDSKVTYDELFESVRTASLLILDDLGSQSTSPWAQEKLYQIINHRYNARLATVITTSHAIEEIDGRLASRMMDQRLSLPILITAPDYRSEPTHPTPRPAPPTYRQRRQR